LRVTETLIQHQIRHRNTSVKVCPPKKEGNDKNFGKVLGLTGNIAYKVIDNFEKFAHLSDPEVKDQIVNTWSKWRDIVKFVDTNTKPTEVFETMLYDFGELLLDTYEWKILTPYTHHGAPFFLAQSDTT